MNMKKRAMMKKNKRSAANDGLRSVILKTVRTYLTYPEGTPVLPVVTKNDVEDIIEMLEQMKQDEDILEDYEANKE